MGEPLTFRQSEGKLQIDIPQASARRQCQRDCTQDLLVQSLNELLFKKPITMVRRQQDGRESGRDESKRICRRPGRCSVVCLDGKLASAELLPGKASELSMTELQQQFLDLRFGMYIHLNMATYRAAGMGRSEGFACAV